MRTNIFSSSFPYRKHCAVVLPAMLLAICIGFALGFRFPYDVFAPVRHDFPIITTMLKCISGTTYPIVVICMCAFIYLAYKKKGTQDGAFYLHWVIWFCIIALGAVELVKFGLGMPRPGHGLIAMPMSEKIIFHSFPSGHASRLFSVFLPIALYFHKKRLSWIFAIYGAIVIFSRLWIGKHHPMDVIGGMLFALLVSYCIFAFMPSTEDRQPEIKKS